MRESDVASVILERSSRLDRARADFGDEVVLSEPYPGRPPLWIEPATAALREDPAAVARWVHDHHDLIEAALLDFGAVMWRGFAVNGPDDFQAMLADFTPFSKGYVAGTSERQAITGKVYESTRTPEDVYIFLHQEMSYQIYSPRLLGFYCHVPATEGGETPICDFRGLLEALPAEMRRRFEETGVIYGRNFRDATVNDWKADPKYRHHSWQHWFKTDDKEEVSRQLDERGISYEWLDDGGMRYWTHRPGVTRHPATGELISFNQLHAQTQHRSMFGDDYMDIMDAAYGSDVPRPYYVHFGDGKPLTDEEWQLIWDEMERRKIAFAWEKGDVLLVDNKLTGHGRHPYKGPREIQVMIFE
jgi:alpha-ketoglutarate-dependent taurine dioxygenase